MKQALHIFRKDVRRLWPAIVLTVLLQTVLVWEDARRADFTPSALEGFLTLLLPAGWAFLIALAVQDEGFVDDRAFWLTRPYSRRSLLIAKVLFLLIAVHAVSLLPTSPSSQPVVSCLGNTCHICSGNSSCSPPY